MGKVGATELIDELGSDLLLILKNRDFTTLSGRGFKKFMDKLLKGWENASEEAGFEILFSQIGFNIFQKNFIRKIGQNVFLKNS